MVLYSTDHFVDSSVEQHLLSQKYNQSLNTKIVSVNIYMFADYMFVSFFISFFWRLLLSDPISSLFLSSFLFRSLYILILIKYI